MNSTRSNLLKILTLIVVVVVGCIAGYSRYSGSLYKTYIEKFIDEQRSQGLVITYDQLLIQGWPWQHTATVSRPTISINHTVSWQVQTEGQMIIGQKLFNPVLEVRFDKPVDIRLASPMDFSANINYLSIDILREVPSPELSIMMRDVALKQNNHDHTKINTLSVSFSPMTKAHETRDNHTLEIDARHIISDHIIFKEIESLSATLISHELSYRDTIKETLNAWAHSDGTIDVKKFMMKADSLYVQGKGSWALDDNLQPVATLSTQMSGVEDTINNLLVRKIITKNMSNVYKSAYMLAMMLNKSQDLQLSFDPAITNDKMLNLSLTIQDQALSVGAIKVLNLPYVDWDKMELTTLKK